MSQLFAFLCLVFAAGLCGCGSDRVPRQSKPSVSQLKVIGGSENPHLFPKTLQLMIMKFPAMETCTGTFITDALLLTAAHCLHEASAVIISSHEAAFASHPPSSQTFSIHPDFNQVATQTQDAEGNAIPGSIIPMASVYADIGIVRFAPHTAPPEFIAKLAATQPVLEQPVFLAGYGIDQIHSRSFGVKRSGRNVIAAIPAELNHIMVIMGQRYPQNASVDASGAVSGEGDSGGAVYNAEGEVLGTVSSGNLVESLPDLAFSYFANVTAEKTRNFIDSILQQAASADAP